MNNERMAARWGPISLLQGDLLLLAQRALDETGEADSLVLGATLDPVTPEMVLGGVSPQGLEAWHLLRATYVMTDRATVRSAAFLVSNAVGVVGENHGFGLVEHTIVPCRFYSFDAQFQAAIAGPPEHADVAALRAQINLLTQQRDEARRLARALKNGDASPEEVQAEAAWLYEGDEDENADDFDSEQDVDGEPDGVPSADVVRARLADQIDASTSQATATSGPTPEGFIFTADPQATFSVSVVGLDGREMRPPAPTSPPCGCTAGARDAWSCDNGNIPGVCTRRGPCGCACHVAKAGPA
jgi:hypothetical protein